MNIKLCNNSDENFVINKYVKVLDTVTATIKGALSIESPVFILEYKSDIKSKINYVVIDELNRCYFITDIIHLTGYRYEIHCKVDVLESFKNNILGLSCIIDKQNSISNANMYYDDGSFVLLNKENNSVINFPNGFNEQGEFILITAGGGGLQ